MIISEDKDKIIKDAVKNVNLEELEENLQEGQFVDQELLKAVLSKAKETNKLTDNEIGLAHQYLRTALSEWRSKRNYLHEEFCRSLTVMREALE